MSVLSQILADKRNEVDCAMRRVPLAAIAEQARAVNQQRDFKAALCRPGQTNLIAEVKKASPSKGVIREDFDPVEIARTYAAHGASSISVLTDEKYFQGKLSYLSEIRKVVDVPLLRKDFIIDPYQIFEARAAGADAILLIVAALTVDEIIEYLRLATELHMASLIEVHDIEETRLAIEAGAEIIGINNRNLHTFRTTLATTEEIMPVIPNGVISVSESGINSRSDVDRLERIRVNAILVGECLMRQPDIGVGVDNLLNPVLQSVSS
ncbi:MAG: indole-3-glycerol phosphate synthase TrpC [Chthonomonadales bacterium]